MKACVPESVLNAVQVLAEVSRAWDDDIVQQLEDYIRIPAKSPMFDADWVQHGYIDTVVRNAASWVGAQKIAGLTLEIIQLEGRTPVLFFEVDAFAGTVGANSTRTASGQTVLMYGHLDKQPEFTGWRADLGPWTPKYEDGKLYGRGAADDGYAVYASIAAIAAIQSQGGTIPLINMLSVSFPKAQMMVCGVLGPNSNAHGPNGFLHVPYAKKLTAAVAQVIAQVP